MLGISASGPTKRWDIENYINLAIKLNKVRNCRFIIAAGKKDQEIIDKIKKSKIGENCLSLDKFSIQEILPIFKNCDLYIGNDTGWANISAALNLKSLYLFCDSPSDAYGAWRNKIEIIITEGEIVCKHNTRGKDRMYLNEVVGKALEMNN